MQSSPPAKVLIVDDVEDNLLTTQLMLARPGLTILLAGSATHALELLTQHEMALAILDVHMPEMDGYELAERMRADPRLSSVPIIFLTGRASDPVRIFRGYEAGAVDFLVKPVDCRVLESKVKVFVEIYLQRTELREKNLELQRMVRLNEAMVQALRQANIEAVQEAHTDALTGVSNRRHILELGEAALTDQRREAQPLCLATIDIDHFKSINDTYGHDAGDEVLREFCASVCKRIRPPSMLGRTGGEEFMLLMPGTVLAVAEAILDRMREGLTTTTAVQYSFSAGIAQAVIGESLAALMKRADNALYEAKRAGRNCSVTSPAPL